ncbi:MAG: mycothiol conjugate amidase Mca [Acidobacteria bacterium]|nr:mycothiol conjugate amidase Mca [Acidobacteriota bacterium]
MNDRCILTVHAHPDDESSKGAGTIARYRADGVRTILVCCTGGEAGDILNDEADSEEARADLAAVRARELDDAVAVIGYDTLHKLGYRDSGMPETEANAHPDCFAQADIDEATGRLVAIIRAERPQVVVTYDWDHGRGHPDHIRVHEIGHLAFDRAGDSAWYPEAGEPWAPSKLYYTGVFTRGRVEKLHAWFEERGEESPYLQWMERWAEREQDPTRPAPKPVTTQIDVSDWMHITRDALAAHRTQVPTTGVWFRVPIEVQRELYPWEDYTLAASRVGGPVLTPTSPPESDLFAGID